MQLTILGVRMKRLILVLLLPMTALGDNSNFRWDPVTSYTDGTIATPSGYRIGCGLTSRQYTVFIEAGPNETSVQSTAIPRSLSPATWYCAARSLSTDSSENSVWGNEVSDVYYAIAPQKQLNAPYLWLN